MISFKKNGIARGLAKYGTRPNSIMTRSELKAFGNAANDFPEFSRFVRQAKQDLQDLAEEGTHGPRADAADFIYSHLPNHLTPEQKEAVIAEAMRGWR